MNKQAQKEFDILMANYPQLSVCAQDIFASFELIQETYLQGCIVMICGNGGSAADAEHMVGELMKGFKLKRPIIDRQRKRLVDAFPDEGDYLADHLQRALPTISLVSQSSFLTAAGNDLAPDMVFAQQVFGYGNIGDVLICISTSGNAQNVINACKVAKANQIRTIGLTGEKGGKLREICDVTICVPANETFRIQEYHLPVYHALCAMIEAELYL